MHANALSLWRIEEGRKEGEVTKSDALCCCFFYAFRRTERARGGTAMHVANRFFARRNSRGVTSWLASSAAGPGGRADCHCLSDEEGRKGGAPPLAKPVRRPSIRHALSRAQSTINCQATHSLFLELLKASFGITTFHFRVD